MPSTAPLPSGHAVRLPLQWARCEPVEGTFDEEALTLHAAAVDRYRARGLVPVVVLHHVGHPRWLGDDLWLRLEAPARFAAWTAEVVTRLGGRCRHWITLEEPNVVAVRSWLSGTGPPGRFLAVGDLVRSLDHLLAAHVVAYALLHGRHPDAMVATTVAPSPLYELGALLTDVLSARASGVGREELPDWLGERRRAWYASRDRPTAVEAAVRRLAHSAVPLAQALPRTVDAAWNAGRDRLLDDLAVPLPPPGRASGGRAPLVAAAGRAVEASVLERPDRR